MAFVDSEAALPQIEMFAIEQLVAAGTVEARPTQPSFLYLPADAEFKPEQLALPWGREGRGAAIVGELARTHGWQVPTRLVSSAKSWLSHAGVDRLSAILPWQAPAEVPKVSPVEASARYLSHIRGAWDHAHPDAPLAEQDLLLTVPASFDTVARELTVRAAAEAGLPHVTLLEEPQAAFYSWLGHAGDRWRNELAVGDVVLVCDVGGGTTDFSLIAVSEVEGKLALERVAVGDHILLGGDNMDLALAHTVRGRLEAEGHKLDNWQFASLAHSCRGAKETLLVRRRSRQRAGGRARPGLEGHRRLGAHRAQAQRRRARARRRLLPARPRSATSRGGPRASACASSACPSPPTRPSRATCRRSSAPIAGRPRCCSTAA